MVTTTNLVSYWKLDEASGTIADSHSSNDGTVSGATYGATGIINDCLSFDGSNDYVTMGDVIDHDFTNTAFSINLWMKMDTKTSNNTMVSKHASSSPWQGYSFTYDSSGRIEIDVTGTGGIVVRKTHTLNTGTWYMLTMTYDGSGNASGVSFYVDGSALTSLTLSQDNLTVSPSTSFPFNISGRNNAGLNPFDGVIDEVSIWTRELSSSDVSDLYNSGSGLAYPFSSDITATPTAIGISMTDEQPTIIASNGQTALTIGAAIQNPSILGTGPVAIVSTLAITATLHEFTNQIISGSNRGSVEVATGTIGTRAIEKDYPYTEGLIAGTTKQVGNPNLVEKGW